MALATANAPAVCEIIDDKLSIPELEDLSHPSGDGSPLSSYALATSTDGVFFHLRGFDSTLEVIMFREVPVDVLHRSGYPCFTNNFF